MGCGVDELVVLEGFFGLLIHWLSIFLLLARSERVALREAVARSVAAQNLYSLSAARGGGKRRCKSRGTSTALMHKETGYSVVLRRTISDLYRVGMAD
jgi:hypothetical protein